jgi:hypothetical protein
MKSIRHLVTVVPVDYLAFVVVPFRTSPPAADEDFDTLNVVVLSFRIMMMMACLFENVPSVYPYRHSNKTLQSDLLPEISALLGDVE